MRPSQHIYFFYFLSLITIFVCTGCVPQANLFFDDTPAPASPVDQSVEEYPNNEYEPGDEVYPDGYYIHTVSVPNENISIIAKWYTGYHKNWVVIAKCNPNLNPNLIFLGNKIKIPRIILTRHTEMTAEFVRKSHSGAQRKKILKNPAPKVKTNNPAVQNVTEEKTIKPAGEEPLFFGPKGY